MMVRLLLLFLLLLHLLLLLLLLVPLLLPLLLLWRRASVTSLPPTATCRLALPTPCKSQEEPGRRSG